jgi:hypothetical protein
VAAEYRRNNNSDDEEPEAEAEGAAELVYREEAE